jgi:hypothetical protein
MDQSYSRLLEENYLDDLTDTLEIDSEDDYPKDIRGAPVCPTGTYPKGKKCIACGSGCKSCSKDSPCL